MKDASSSREACQLALAEQVAGVVEVEQEWAELLGAAPGTLEGTEGGRAAAPFVCIEAGTLRLRHISGLRESEMRMHGHDYPLQTRSCFV